ncbi:MAG: PhoH family protein [Lentisphaerae bacterium]|jgi:PhoH-like ATPase|nr:PhoH family protein [Lentisphaerota bacterium]MBT4820575.1 PhoH family protein [Lentisphaerota bacterium]MBT5611492.1 PhoH family protein [Lentisphaerota bacterium]MBT7056354.1 PhoH family protein [Lentisphaerota bacterium]MBT7842970.1 PhoH family protein [Lentisphaerota bacterium]
MPKNFVIDTNILLHDPQALFHFGDANVLIPLEVIEELDSFKHDTSELGRSSRAVAHILDDLRNKGRLGEGIQLSNGGTLRIVCEPTDPSLSRAGLDRQKRVSNSLLSVAMRLRRGTAGADTTVVTKNVHLRLTADALGIVAQDYSVDRFTDTDVYTGWHTMTVSPETMARLKDGKKGRPEGLSGAPNEYVYAESATGEREAAFCRILDTRTEMLEIPTLREDIVGLKALNREQAFAFDALLDDKIGLVTLTGKAGTGKTLLAVAAGLHKVFSHNTYMRVLVFRPTMPVSRDIGYLPGSIDEKMQPWMQPIYDALELIWEQDKHSPNRLLPPDIMECEEISIEPLTYIRGRSIPRQYIIIDEAQNLTPLELKTVITRVGTGTKIVLTGDPHQIDNPYVDALSNGLVSLIDRFRGSELSAHIGLVKGERSVLAETAANLL